ncbi:GumC family protein [Labilibaculum antarcticum]|uniref:GumC family protein n=1 Tax=Labilibaculum antarcticum TaxID=1717717 RepID=UPI0011AB8B53|nr:hypothetical protein [Labilibaculum antarcticum]
MNIIFFIRLLQKHLLLLAILPIVMVGVVFFLTQDQPKLYDSSTGIYTGIATGSSIVSLEESKLDLFGTRIAFDNLINLIKTKTTIEEVALRLLAKHLLLDGSTPDVILPKHYAELMELVPEKVKALVVKGNPEKTYRNLLAYKNLDHNNFVYELIHLNHRHYSSKEILKEIKVARVQSSDMVMISFNTDDPGICKNTLDLINEVFVRVYSDIKVNQSDAVVSYFLKEIGNSEDNLNVAEEELVEFNKAHNIINYYEQTRHIASEKEHFDLRYTEIKMNHMAVVSVLRLLENRMTKGNQRRLNSTEILALRKSLSEIEHRIWMKSNYAGVNELSSKQDSTDLVDLKGESMIIEQQLKKMVASQYEMDNSKEGLNGNTILDRWIEKIIEFESSKAQLEVGDQIKIEFDDLFKLYAPLGATMKRLERKIDVAEQKYLSLLESLNKAKLKQQNVELNSNLKIVTPPFFPIEARASKRKFLLIIAFMIGFVIPVFFIIVLEFIDSSIKTVVRAEDMIGMNVLSMFPNLLLKNKNTDLELVKNKTLNVLVRKLLLLKSVNQEDKKTVQVSVFSNQKGEGKSFVFDMLVDRLHNLGYKVLSLQNGNADETKSSTFYNYSITPGFHKIKNISELCGESSQIKKEDFDYVFVELPGIMNDSYPVELVSDSDYSIMFVRANRAWSLADQNSLKDYASVSKEDSIKVLLNGVELPEMETILGDLPKERSFIRRIGKNVLRLRFYTKKNIS